MLKCLVNKLSRLISKKFDGNEHRLTNMSSYSLSFFEKLIIFRGLKFSLSQKVSPIDFQACFEEEYWRKEPLLEENDKELVSSKSRSIALILFSVQAQSTQESLKPWIL